MSYLLLAERHIIADRGGGGVEDSLVKQSHVFRKALCCTCFGDGWTDDWPWLMIGKEIRRLGTTALTPKNHDTIIILSSSLKCKSVWLSLWVCICSFLWGVNVSMFGSLLLCSHPAWELQLFLDLTRAPPPAQVFAQKRISFPCLSFAPVCAPWRLI